MEEWIVVSLLLCTFGLLREIRPSEPFVSEFLLGEWHNITQETLYQDVYPVGTYSYLALLVVIFLITDYFKYKPIIILSGLAGITVYCILLWTESLQWLQASQFFYGLYMATEIAYYTYMFAKVKEDKYDKVASYTRSSALIGRFISGLLAQLLISFNALNYRELNYITLMSQFFATLWSLFLPSVNRSIYFHREIEIPDATNNSINISRKVKGSKLIWEHIASAYSRKTVVAWSLWYAASSAGFFQVQSYVQILWIEIEPEQKNIYNGIVEAVLTALGATAALLGGIKLFKNENYYTILPAIAAAIQAAAIVLICYASEVWQSYIGYIVLGVIFHYMITITSAKIAHQLIYDNCFGLIFGINTFVALTIQSILTIIIISPNGLELSIIDQYKAYAIYYGIVSIIGLIYWVITYCNGKKHV